MTPPAVAVSHRAGRTVYAQRLRPAAGTMTPPAVADLPHARARGGAGVGAPIELLGDLDVLEGPVGQPSAPVRVVQLAIEELRFRQRRALEANVAPGGPRRGGVTVDRSNELVGEGGPRERRLVGQLVVPPGEAGQRRDGNRSHCNGAEHGGATQGETKVQEETSEQNDWKSKNVEYFANADFCSHCC